MTIQNGVKLEVVPKVSAKAFVEILLVQTDNPALSDAEFRDLVRMALPTIKGVRA